MKLNPSAYSPTEESGIDTNPNSPTFGLIKPKKENIEPQPKTELSSLSSTNGAKIIGKDLNFLKQSYPEIPALPQVEAQKPSLTQTEPTGSATYTDELGRKYKFSQKELDTPEVQEQIKNLSFVEKDPNITTPKEDRSSILKREADNTNQAIASLYNNINSWNIDQDPDFKSQANSIRAKFDQLREEMKQVNYQRQRAYETLGFRTGATQYTGGKEAALAGIGQSVQEGIESEEIRQGGQRLTDITVQEEQMLAQARNAFRTQKYSEFNNRVSMLKDLREQKQEELSNFNKSLVDAQKRMQEEQKFLLEKQKSFYEMQKISQDVIGKNIDSYASGFVDLDEKGNVTMASPEDLQQFAKMSGYSYEQIVGAVRKKAYELSKLSQEDRLKELQISKAQAEALNAGLSSAEQEWQNAIRRKEFSGTFLDWIKAKSNAERKTGGGVGGSIGGGGIGGGIETVSISQDLDTAANSLLGIVGATGPARQNFLNTFNTARKRGEQYAWAFLRNQYANKVLSSTDAQDYKNVQNAVPNFDAAIKFIENNSKLDMGFWKSTTEGLKPKLLIKKDPKYTEFLSLVNAAETPFRKSQYGTAITGTELSIALRSLLNTDDDRNAVLQKLKTARNAAVNGLNRNMFESFGLVGNINTEQISGIGQLENTVVMTGPQGTFNVPKNQVEIFKKNGYK